MASIISLRAGSMIARASSGSRSSISSIDPLMSANRAVTVLRSPSSSPGAESLSFTRITAESGATLLDGCAATLRGAAHSKQNLAVGGFWALQEGQLRQNGDAHSTQNLALSGFSAPHFEQRICASPTRDPYGPMDASSRSWARK